MLASSLLTGRPPPASSAGWEAGGRSRPAVCYGLDTTVAFTIMDVSVIVSFPCLARPSIMSSLVGGFR